MKMIRRSMSLKDLTRVMIDFNWDNPESIKKKIVERASPCSMYGTFLVGNYVIEKYGDDEFRIDTPLVGFADDKYEYVDEKYFGSEKHNG